MKLIKYQYLFIASLLIALFSCEEGGDGGIEPNPTENFTARAEGQPFESGGEFVAAELDFEEGYYFLSVVAYDYENINTGRGRSIAITVSGSDFDDLEAGDEFTNYSIYTGLGAIGTYLNHQTYADYHGGTSLTQEESIYVKITEIDKDNHLISGEFSFDVYDDEERIYEVRDGVFNKLNYIIGD